MKKGWILIGKIHVNGKNNKNSWKSLSRGIKTKIYPLEDTKGVAETNKSKNTLKVGIAKYNQKNNTDFFV